jgi:hypothetical protein
MFDLEQAVQEWRQTMALALCGQSDVIDELESHLRDEVQRLVQAGQMPQQAWKAALDRLGSSEQLTVEFGKLATVNALSWRPAQVLFLAHAAIALLLAWLLMARWWNGVIDSLLTAHIFIVTVGYSAMFAVGAIAVWSVLARALGSWNPVRTGALRATVLLWTTAGLTLTAAGVVLGGWWASEHLGRIWAWDPKETAAVTVLAWNSLVLLSMLGRPLSERTTMAMGLVGNIVISLCWFGPPALAGTPMVWYLGAFVVIQVPLLVLAFLPAGRLRRKQA